MDWFVLITPLVVLGVLLLLGFAGCDVVFGLEYVGTVKFKVRIPPQFTVIEARFTWIRPGATVEETTTTLTTEPEEEGDVVLARLVSPAEEGTWSVTCSLNIQDTTAQATAEATHQFMHVKEQSETVVFDTRGRPNNNNFQVVFQELIP